VFEGACGKGKENTLIGAVRGTNKGKKTARERGPTTLKLGQKTYNSWRGAGNVISLSFVCRKGGLSVGGLKKEH